MSDIRLSSEELESITGYTLATKQLQVLKDRGFFRAFINRKGEVVLERTHYEAVTKSEPRPELRGTGKVANLSHFHRTA